MPRLESPPAVTKHESNENAAIARPVRPTDLVALVSFDGHVYPNEAHTWESLGRERAGPRLLENALEQWFAFATGRHTWISIDGQTIRGMISARQRGSRLAWEVDCLIAATAGKEPLYVSLLSQLVRAAMEARVLRVFLRVAADSSVVIESARRVGFFPYVAEHLYRLTTYVGNLSTLVAPALTLRPRSPADGPGLFRLYNAVTPKEVREHEAMTYTEWLAAQERRGEGRGRVDLVAEEDGEVLVWLRAVPDGTSGRIDLLAQPSLGRSGEALLAQTLGSLGSRRPVHCLIPVSATYVAQLLACAGFERVEEYTSLVKRLAVPVRAHAPVRAPARSLLAAI